VCIIFRSPHLGAVSLQTPCYPRWVGRLGRGAAGKDAGISFVSGGAEWAVGVSSEPAQ